jgi:hypothetical protein
LHRRAQQAARARAERREIKPTVSSEREKSSDDDRSYARSRSLGEGHDAHRQANAKSPVAKVVNAHHGGVTSSPDDFDQSQYL